MSQTIVHVFAGDDDPWLFEEIQAIATAQCEEGNRVALVLPSCTVEQRLQADEPGFVIFEAPGDCEIEALTDAADVIHVHGAGSLFHRFARAGLRTRKLVAEIPAESTFWRLAASEPRADRKMRKSLQACGFVAVHGPTGSPPYVPRCWGLRFMKSHDEAKLAVQSSYQSVIGQAFRTVLGLQIKVTDRDRAVNWLDERIQRSDPLKLAFVNANAAMKCRSILPLLEEFSFLNDGLGINLASKLLYGSPFQRNLNGTDFVPYFLTHTSRKLKIFLLGGRQSVVTRTQHIFASRWPGHEIVGLQDGYFDEKQAQMVAENIAAAKPDIVLVAMGNPRQELWVARYIPEVAPIGICVGALFDFMTGEVARAPAWVRAMQMEWLFRLLQEPKRLARRYLLESPAFLFQVYLQCMCGARARGYVPGNSSLYESLLNISRYALRFQMGRASVYRSLSGRIDNSAVQGAFAMMQLNREHGAERFVGDYFQTLARFLEPNLLPIEELVDQKPGVGKNGWSLGQATAFGTIASLLMWAGLFGIFHFVA